jgi:hypothetical protein
MNNIIASRLILAGLLSQGIKRSPHNNQKARSQNPCFLVSNPVLERILDYLLTNLKALDIKRF